jgi:transaldolase
MSAVRGSPLHRLAALGQSIWLDDIRRVWLEDGTLARLIVEDAVSGVTSNPAIFEKAIAEHHDYDRAIVELAHQGRSVQEIYETLTVADIQHAADLLRGVHERTAGRDGYVSLEVSPHLAHDTEATVAEAQRLWARVARPNLMIKVPGTTAGMPAIRKLIALGINVNVTLLFGVTRYRAVAESYLAGLEDRWHAGDSLAGVASVASFFLSRIDTLVDSKLDALGTPETKTLRGEAAIASARLAYQHYKEWTASPRWQALVAAGARPQRLLWASTSTKDKTYSEVKYIEALIAPDTVNTLPSETLAAYRDQGDPAVRIGDDPGETHALPARLAALGLELDGVAGQLEREGVRKFIEPYDRLFAVLARRAAELVP